MSESVNEAASTSVRVWCIDGSRVDWRAGEPCDTVESGEAERVEWVKDGLAGFECEGLA